MSSFKSISSSIVLLENMYFFSFPVVNLPFPFETKTIVDEVGLADKTGIGLTRGRLKEVLIVSKIDVAPKIVVQVGMGELIDVKIGADEVKIVVPVGTLTVHFVVELDELTDVADDSVNEDGCSSVDEVVDTCIYGT